MTIQYQALIVLLPPAVSFWARNAAWSCENRTHSRKPSLVLRFRRRLREMRSFDNLEALREQLSADEAACRELLRTEMS